MKKFTVAGLIGLGLLLGGCNAQKNNDNVLVMGTSADYYPFEYIDENTNEIVGFDVDLAKYVAEQLGYELEVRDMDFNTLVTALRSEKVDLVAAGMTATPERMEVVDFTDPYHTSSNVILALSEKGYADLDALSGLTLGAQSGSLQEEALLQLQEQEQNIDISTLERVPDLVQQVLIGRIDGLIIEEAVVNGYLENFKNLGVFEVLPQDDSGGSSIAFAKGSDKTEKVNEILAEMKENGKYDELINKWFN
jgi:polar amino acid transport system substrate-binding protein